MQTRKAVVIGLGAALALGFPVRTTAQKPDIDLIPLPAPRHTSATSVEQALSERRSIREFMDEALSLEEVSQLLWAAQGVTEPGEAPEMWREEWGKWMGGVRTAPSAGALYPLEVYLVAGEVDGLQAGLYRYIALEHALEPSAEGDLREALAEAALRQAAITAAPAVVVITAVYQRTAGKYGERATRYVHIEVGAAGQNIYLQAETLGLGTVFIGAFRDEPVQLALGLPTDHGPLAIMPVGRRTADWEERLWIR